MSINKKDHWENIYMTKAGDKVSWFQPYPNTSMEFVKLFNLPLNANITEGGKPVKTVRYENGYAIVVTGSGNYSFTASNK